MILISAAGGGGTNSLLENRSDLSRFIGITNDKYKLFTSILEKNCLAPHAGDEKNYIEVINRIIKKENVTLFIPNSDYEALIAAKYHKDIEANIFLPSYEFISITFDKWEFYKKATLVGVKMAKTFHAVDRDSIETAFEMINTRPLWCRVKDGSGSKYTTKVDSVEDACNYIDHLCRLYNVNKDQFLLSEYLAGEDMAVMTIWQNGSIKMCKMAKRTRYNTHAGESPPNILESFYDKKVEDFVIDSIKKLETTPHGILNVDIKCYEDGELAITEINAGRFYYNMPLFNSGNIHAFELYLKMAYGEDVKTFESEDPQVIFIRDQDNKPKVISKKNLEKSLLKVEQCL